ncbi:MAG: hypothetical protein AAGC60_29420 [Acidobacteriota bacterium]
MLVAALGCSAAPTLPRLQPLADTPKTVPVVLVPGISGTALRDRATGETVWGEGRNVLTPWDGGYRLARSIHLGPGERDALEPAGVIEELRVAGLARKSVYGPLPEMLEAHGYRRGDLAVKEPRGSLFLFAYDWRDDNLLAARLLARRLEALAAARDASDDDPLEVDLICQSNGAHICRYLLKYGDVSLDDAEAGRGRPLTAVRVRKLLLVGTSNGGGLRLLREIDRGRRYVPLVGRRILPETLFTLPALFQDLPAHETHPFVDRDGRRLAIDLFDAEAWVHHGWSVFDDATRARLDEIARPDLFGTETERIAYLGRVLERAERLHRLLARDVDIAPTRIYLLQNGYEPTPHLAVVTSDGNLLFTGDRELDDTPYLDALISQPGDGHATLESQHALSPSERALLAADPFLVQDRHFELILHPGTLRRILDFLLDEPSPENAAAIPSDIAPPITTTQR